MGIVNYMDSKGTIRRILFNRQNQNMSFQAVGRQDDCIVFCLDTESVHIEKELLFRGAESLLIVLKTSNSVVFIGYDGDHEALAVTFCSNYDAQPSIAELMQLFFELPKR